MIRGCEHEIVLDAAPAPIDREGRGHGRVIGRFGLSWMKTYLEEDPRYKQFLTKGKPSGLAAYMTNVM